MRQLLSLVKLSCRLVKFHNLKVITLVEVDLEKRP